MSAQKRAIENDKDEHASKMQCLLENVYTCPITYEIPFDPVTAEDGIVYERRAIQDWFNTIAGHEVRSPVTNSIIRKRVFPAIQFRNLIRNLAVKGHLTGNIAEQWKQRFKEEEEVESFQRRARAGELTAMLWLAKAFSLGVKGLQKDVKLAFHWSKLASNKGDATAMSHIGHMLINGCGTQKNVSLGLLYMTRAAELGSEYACYQLGIAFKEGIWGLGCDEELAYMYFAKSCSCQIRNGSVASRAKVQSYMNQIRPETLD